MRADEFFDKANSIMAGNLLKSTAFDSGTVNGTEDNIFAEDSIFAGDDIFAGECDNYVMEQVPQTGINSIAIHNVVVPVSYTIDNSLLSDAVKSIAPQGVDFLIEQWNSRFDKCNTVEEVLHKYALMRYAIEFSTSINIAEIDTGLICRLSPAPKCIIDAQLLQELSSLSDDTPLQDFLMFRHSLDFDILCQMLESKEYVKDEALQMLTEKKIGEYAARCISDGKINTDIFDNTTNELLLSAAAKNLEVDTFELSQFKNTRMLNAYLAKIVSGEKPYKPFWFTSADIPEWFVEKYLSNNLVTEDCDSYQEYTLHLDTSQLGIKSKAPWNSKDLECIVDSYYDGTLSDVDYRLYLFINYFKTGYNFHFNSKVPAFNIYCMEQLAKKMGTEIVCPSFVGHTVVVLKDSGKMNLYDCEKVLISDIDFSGVSSPCIQFLDDYSGVLISNPNNTGNIQKVRKFSFSTKGSMRSWAEQGIACESVERFHLYTVVRNLEKDGLKVSPTLYEYIRSPYEAYQQVDRAFSYACEIFPELLGLFTTSDIPAHVRNILPFTHVKSKKWFLFKFLKITFSSLAHFNITLDDMVNCFTDTIEIELNGKQMSVTLSTFFKSIDELKLSMLEFKNSQFVIKDNKIFIKIS